MARYNAGVRMPREAGKIPGLPEEVVDAQVSARPITVHETGGTPTPVRSPPLEAEFPDTFGDRVAMHAVLFWQLRFSR